MGGEKSSLKGALIYDINEFYSIGIKNLFQSQKLDLDIIGFLGDTTNYKEIKERLDQSKYDYLIIPVYEEKLVSIFENINFSKMKDTLFIGTDAWAYGSIFRRYKEKLKPFSAVWSTHLPENLKTAKDKAFLSSYKEKYKRDAKTDAAIMTYDSAIFAKYIVRNNLWRNPEKMENKMLEGLNGKFRFNSNEPKRDVYLREIYVE